MNSVYPYAKKQFLAGAIKWPIDKFKVALLRTDRTYGYKVDLENDLVMADIQPSAIIAISEPLVTSICAGAADADDITFLGVDKKNPGDIISAMIIYQDTGNRHSDTLIAYIGDCFTNKPIIPDTGDILITWDNGPYKVFLLPHEQELI